MSADEPLPDRPIDATSPLLTPEEEAAFMRALATQRQAVEERFRAPAPMSPFVRRAVITLLLVLTAAAGRAGYVSYRAFAEARIAGPIAADLRAIRAAAIQIATVNGAWPSDAAPGEVPPALVPVLGARPFARGPVPYDWDVVTVDSAGATSTVAMITAHVTSPAVSRALQGHLGNEPHRVTAAGVALIVSGTGALPAAAPPR